MEGKSIPSRWNIKFNVKFQLITMLIGPNDFCIDMCYHKHPERIIDYHERDLLAVFRTIRDNLKRTMVNVILPPCKLIRWTILMEIWIESFFQAIEILLKFKGKPAECSTLHSFECPCFFGSRYQKFRQRYFKIIQDFKRKVIEVANREEFHDRKVSFRRLKCST